MRGREREEWLIQLANVRGRGRRGHTSAFGRRWACPESARDDCARVISDRKWPLKKISVITHIKASLEPRLTFGGRGKRAWYTLSAHAPKFPEILGIRIFIRLSIRKREP